MDEAHLYRQIAEEIRESILKGQLNPGDRLPSIRQVCKQWNCTPGTVQRAFGLLAGEGLLVSRAGQGTHVVAMDRQSANRTRDMIRKASLLHRAEGYLLEGLSAGNSLLNLQQAVDLAVDRWRTAESASHAQRTEKAFRFAGSHDLAVNWLAAHFDEIAPGCSLNITFNGSLAGLVALSQDEADLAGCHLCDPESGEYNLPFVRRILPGRAVKIVTMAHRRLGLITPPGNPLKVSSVADLTKQHLRFINRQPGSGTRSWLDMALQRTGIDPATINGYQNFATTHTEVARSIAEGTADAGIGLESAADAFGLDFIFQTRERYDLVMTADFAETPPAAKVLKWLKKKGRNSPLAGIKGYDLTEMGEIRSLQSPV